MKTETRFYVWCNEGLTYAQYRYVKRFAQLILAEVSMDRTSVLSDGVLITLDVEIDGVVGFHITRRYLITDFVRWFGDDEKEMRNFICNLRRDLFAETGEFIRVNVKKTAPPMPPEPEPEPVYIDTDYCIHGLQIALVSSGNDNVDSEALDQVGRAVEFISMVIRRSK